MVYYSLAMDKFSLINLWDIYGELFTDSKKDISDLFFNHDLTVSEIAEERKISRQAVSDCLKECKSKLEEYEEKLHLQKKLYEDFLFENRLVERVKSWADELLTFHPELLTEVNKLKDILKKN